MKDFLFKVILITLILGVFINVFKSYNFERSNKSNKGAENFTKSDIEQNRSTNPKMQYFEEKFPENYIERAFEFGNLVRWNSETFPLKVYIEKNQDIPDYFYYEVKDAFEAWHNASNGFLTFSYIDYDKNADIRCYFPSNYDYGKNSKGVTLGDTHFEDYAGKLKFAQINFGRYLNGKYYSEQRIYNVALHEIGHALGIRGHSINKNDIMYPITNHANSKYKISKGDLSTLRLMYSIVPDVSNKDFSKNMQETFLTAEDIFGKSDERLDLEIKNIQGDIEHSILDKSRSIRMASLYLKKNDYFKAIQYYKISLNYISDKNQQMLVEHDIAYCYYRLGQYFEAAKYLENLINSNYANTDVFDILGDIYYKQKNYSGLISLYKKSSRIQNTKKRLDVSYNFAYYQYEMQQYAEAEKILKNIIMTDGNYRAAYGLLGSVYVKQNNYKELEALYMKGKNRFSNDQPLKKK